MFIHWFPGHMTKAIRMMEKEMSVVDSVIYVLDARAPKSCINPAFSAIIGQKPVLYVLNKSDLVPIKELKKWQDYFNKYHSKCILANSTVKGGVKPFISALREINREKLERYAAKGVKKTIRAMVIGVPNCGKSTLINSLISKKRAVTGDKPGVTRGKQWISIDNYIDLLDTPGTLYPDFSDQIKATNLAILGSINQDVLDLSELANEILIFLYNNYPNILKEKYSIVEISEKISDNLENVAKRRGFMLRGGEYDLERTAKAIVNDFRKHAYGDIILEKCE